MLDFLDVIRGMDTLSLALRFVCALICGGVIGLEREYKRRPVGFRTHILICLGAAMTTMTGQYLAVTLGYDTDISRLGAQVIAGVGFIGAGAIIVTKHSRVKGLTTAAGLWTAAIIGLACGAGFYEGAIIATLMILISEILFVRLEYRFMRQTRELNVYLEYDSAEDFERVTAYLHTRRIRINDIEFGKGKKNDEPKTYAVFSVRLSQKEKHDGIISDLSAIEGIGSVEEL
ncbi:MAG: MgtC/SapB family protein [Eubacteriales bacterium]|nr:MgtC/SapB family protein [Eubacteriales bacterium]